MNQACFSLIHRKMETTITSETKSLVLVCMLNGLSPREMQIPIFAFRKIPDYGLMYLQRRNEVVQAQRFSHSQKFLNNVQQWTRWRLLSENPQRVPNISCRQPEVNW